MFIYNKQWCLVEGDLELEQEGHVRNTDSEKEISDLFLTENLKMFNICVYLRCPGGMTEACLERPGYI